MPLPTPDPAGSAVWVVDGRVWLDAEALAAQLSAEARTLAAHAGGPDASVYDQARAETMTRLSDQLAAAVASARDASGWPARTDPDAPSSRGRHRR